MQQDLPSPITFLSPSAELSSRSALCQLSPTLFIAPTEFPLEDLLHSLVKFLMALVLVLLPLHLICNRTHSGLTDPALNSFLSS